jgi:hypothetical protein
MHILYLSLTIYVCFCNWWLFFVGASCVPRCDRGVLALHLLPRHFSPTPAAGKGTLAFAAKISNIYICTYVISTHHTTQAFLQRARRGINSRIDLNFKLNAGAEYVTAAFLCSTTFHAAWLNTRFLHLGASRAMRALC